MEIKLLTRDRRGKLEVRRTSDTSVSDKDYTTSTEMIDLAMYTSAAICLSEIFKNMASIEYPDNSVIW